MLRLSFPGAFKILNVQNIPTGRTSEKYPYFIKIVSNRSSWFKHRNELLNREENVVDTLKRFIIVE
jgi:hypothetical protein